jgi:hypothetical protein
MRTENGKWTMENDVAQNNVRRRFIFFVALALFSIFDSQFSIAQHYVGVKAGYGLARGRFYTIYGTPESSMMWNNKTAGVVWKYFSPLPVFGGVSAEMEFQQRGYRIYDNGSPQSISAIVSDSTSYRAKTRTVSSLTVPLIWQPHFYMFNRRARFFLSAGVTFSYNTGIGDTFTADQYTAKKVVDDASRNLYHWEQTVETTTIPYTMQTARDVRWNYGWLGGAGVSILLNRVEIFAEGRYYYGMSDILRTKSRYVFNEEESIRSELDNIYITMGVTFRLGKGGILAPPLSKRRRAQAASDDFTTIKTNR